jgi:hypothetical protein
VFGIGRRVPRDRERDEQRARAVTHAAETRVTRPRRRLDNACAHDASRFFVGSSRSPCTWESKRSNAPVTATLGGSA